MILLTHHHADHTAGVDEVRARFHCPVVGAAADEYRLPKLDETLKEGDTVRLGGATAQVIDTPGHTRGQIAFFFPDGGVLLSGDTLFSLGCGRLSEGTPEEMYASLRKLAALPGDTKVCCGHEYTESNARFALAVDPDNADLHAFVAKVEQLRSGRPAQRPLHAGRGVEGKPVPAGARCRKLRRPAGEEGPFLETCRRAWSTQTAHMRRAGRHFIRLALEEDSKREALLLAHKPVCPEGHGLRDHPWP